MKNKILIENDVFCVVRQLKSIDKDYTVYYDKIKNRFEVHNRKNGANSLAVVSPFKSLDSRLVKMVRQTRVEYMDKLIADMEANNLKLEMDTDSRILDEAKYKSKNLIKYLERGGSNIPSYSNI